MCEKNRWYPAVIEMPTSRYMIRASSGIQSSNPFFHVYQAVPTVAMIGVPVRKMMLIQSFLRFTAV